MTTPKTHPIRRAKRRAYKIEKKKAVFMVLSPADLANIIQAQVKAKRLAALLALTGDMCLETSAAILANETEI